MKQHTLMIGILLLINGSLALAQINLSSDGNDYSNENQFMKMCTEYNSERADREEICSQIWISYKN